MTAMLSCVCSRVFHFCEKSEISSSQLRRLIERVGFRSKDFAAKQEQLFSTHFSETKDYFVHLCPITWLCLEMTCTRCQSVGERVYNKSTIHHINSTFFRFLFIRPPPVLGSPLFQISIETEKFLFFLCRCTNAESSASPTRNETSNSAVYGGV